MNRGFSPATKRFLRKMAERIPLSIHMSVTKRDALALYYHVVSDEALPHIRHLYPYKAPAMFENDLIYLAENFNLVTYEQLAAHFCGGQRLDPKSVLLTFDDGLSECYSVVRPLLLKHNTPCVFFITTDYIDNHRMGCEHKASLCIDRILSLESSALQDVMKSVGDSLGKGFDNGADLIRWVKSTPGREHSAIDALCRLLGVDVKAYLESRRPYLTSEEIRRLSEDGFAIGAHSVRHQQLGSLTDTEMEEDITESCKAIMALTGQKEVPFAFPFSADGVSRDALQALRKRHGYIGLLFDTNGVRLDRDFIVSRMCGDWPGNSDPAKSNLPRRLVRAYLEDLALRGRRLRDRTAL